MDLATELTLRAVVRGLFHADAIDANQVRAVYAALEDAAGAAMDRNKPAAAMELVSLVKTIKTDTAVL